MIIIGIIILVVGILLIRFTHNWIEHGLMIAVFGAFMILAGLLSHPIVVEASENKGYPIAGITEQMADSQSRNENLPEECLIRYFGYVPSDAELLELYQIVQDEAGNTECEDGIGAVADVIANRCRSSKFPNTIHEVLYQKNAFEPIVNNTFGRFEITDLTLEICDDHISEGPVDSEILYFTAGDYNPYCIPMYQIGNHYFGK